MRVRARFVSIWSLVATIFFFGDIFLDYKPFGYSGMMLGIFMWIIGGSVASAIFGPSKSPSKSTRRKKKRSASTSIKTGTSNNEESQFCIACGSEYGKNDTYCPECGTVAPVSDQELPAK